MSEEKRYKILELVTTGYHLIDNRAYNLTKEECDIKLETYLDDGIAPNRLRAVPSQTRDEGLPQIDS